MTKETKIGLLVGLAFIILFAIILSEKGTTHRSTALPTFTVAEATKLGDPISSAQPLSDAGRLPIDSQLPPIVAPQPMPRNTGATPMTEEQVVINAPTDSEEAPPLPASVVSMLNAPVEGASASPNESSPSKPPVIAVGPPAPSGDEPLNATPAKPTANSAAASTDAAVVKAAPETRVVDATPPANRPVEEARPAAQPSEETPAASPLAIKKIHTVEKGQSLGKIAAQYYGRSTPQRVKALFEANQPELKSPASIRTGQQLKIPDLGEASDQFEPASPFAHNRAPIAQATPSAAPAVAARMNIRGASPSTIRIPVPISEKPQSAGAPRAVRDDAIASSQDAKSSGSKSEPSAYIIYEVKPKDTLSGIARRQLGNERLFKEIFRLNRDVLKNKSIIRPGMKLKLPVPSAADVAESNEVRPTAVTVIDRGDTD